MTGDNRRERFERAVLPNMDAIYNLARWLTGDNHDAEDVAQEASLRAYRFIDTFRGGDPRPWLLRIVRNTAYSWLGRNRPPEQAVEVPVNARSADDPMLDTLRKADTEAIRRGMDRLPADYREVLVLREMEDLPYKEIAEVMSIPIGTVMSRLARARKLLREYLLEEFGENDQ